MSERIEPKLDDELNEFIEEVTDGAYKLPCYEVILKLVKRMRTWGDEACETDAGMGLSHGLTQWF